MTFSRALPIFLTAFGLAASAMAAELPSRKADPPKQVKTCEIGGKPGYLLPGADVCLRLSGYVSGQITMGTLAK